MDNMKVFTCRDRYDDMATCIYEAWSMALQVGHDQIKLRKEPAIMGKPERRHLKKLSEQINDYCLEKEVFSINDLYQDFGRPSEISNTYFSNIDINDFVKRIQLSKWLKRGIAIFLLIALIAVTVYSIDSYCTYKVFERESIYFEETEITD